MSSELRNKQGRCPVSGCSKTFKIGHLGIDAHVVSAHAPLLDGTTKQELYATFKRRYPRPWPFVVDADNVRRFNRAQPGTVPPTQQVGDDVDRSRRQVETPFRAPFEMKTLGPSATVIGVDFAGPKEAGQQRRKIIAIAAQRLGPCHYVVKADGFNARLTQNGPPGWTALELAEELDTHRAGLVALDFPFSLPALLISDIGFAERVSHTAAFGSWHNLNQFIAERLSLGCPIDLEPFAGWRDKSFWQLRATDAPARAQPALKHKFQVLFNMSLLGQAFLARLRSKSDYRIDPFDAEAGQSHTVIEIYPGATMRLLDKPDYKRDPIGAIETILGFCREQGIAIDVDPNVRVRCETYGMDRTPPDPDVSDAFVALCTAILYREGLCQRLLEDRYDDRIAIEGAIWVPIVLPRLVDSAEN